MNGFGSANVTVEISSRFPVTNCDQETLPVAAAISRNAEGSNESHMA